MIIHLVLLGGFLIAPRYLNAQSGWTKPKGELFSRVGYQYFTSSRYFNLSGGEVHTSRFVQQSISLYGEYGLTDRLNILLDWPVFKAHHFTTTESIQGVGDMKLGLKYAIVKKIPISFAVIPEFPIARANRLAQNKTIPSDYINLPTGDGELNVFNILSVSTSLSPLPGYINAFGAFNYRTRYEDIPLSNQWLAGLEVGGKFYDLAWLKAAIKIQNTQNGQVEQVSFVRGEGTEYCSINFGIYAPIKEGWGVDFSYFNYMDFLVTRKNIYSSPTFSLGIIYELKKDEE